MSTINATNIVADTLVGNTSANAITVRGEGSATTSLQQGLSKAWTCMNGTGTPAINDSLNTASITDHGTGNFSCNWSNAMGNQNYAMTQMGGSNNTVNPGACHSHNNLGDTTSFKFFSKKFDGAVVDMHFIGMVAHGDLA